MKTNYLVTAQCEVLVEYANAVMAKYEKYLRSDSALVVNKTPSSAVKSG